MFGAIKPPWIEKRDFYRTPFNYCDRWCERCQLTEICKVFQEEKKEKKKFIAQGRDPYSWECVFESMHNNFQKTMKLILKDAQKMGIDLSKIDDSDYKEPPKPDEFPLYRLADKFSKKLATIFKDLEAVPIESDVNLIKENIDVIAHYLHLVQAKVYRALTSRLDDEEGEEDLSFDAKTSGFIAVNGLLSTAEALNNLAKHKPLITLKKKLLSLGKLSLGLAETLDLEFDLKICW